MKKIIFLILILVNIHIFAMTNNISIIQDRYLILNDTPAIRGFDKSSYLFFPFISANYTFTNTLINFRDLKMFYKDHYLTKNDKKILTRGDLKVFFNYKIPIIKLGLKNYGMDLSFFSGFKATVFEKEFSKLILYGNDKDEYTLHNGKGSILYGFSKLKFYFAYPKVNLDFISIPDTKYITFNKVVEYIKNLPLYFGVNLNFYFPIYYGEVLNSEQNFGSNSQHTYANYYLNLLYTDLTESDYRKKITTGIGFSMMADLKKGYFYLNIDDIFAGIKFNNLTQKIFQGTIEDTLTHLNSDYEMVNNDTIIEKTTNRYKSISGSFNIGIEYEIYEGFKGSLQYSNSKYTYPNGFNIGIRKTVLDFIPFAFKMGYDNIMNYQFISGVYLTNLELYLKFTTFGGFFNYANGIGLEFNWIQRFW